MTRDPATSSASTPPAGTYVLLLSLARPSTLEVGALGTHRLPAGGYAYVGSAFGPGGLGRVDRHREVAAGERSVRHWHVDYLLGQSACSVVADRRLPDVDAECALAGTLLDPGPPAAEEPGSRDHGGVPGDQSVERGRGSDDARPTLPVEGFGASDCDCPGHLLYRDTVDALRAAVADAVAEVVGDDAGRDGDGETADDRPLG